MSTIDEQYLSKIYDDLQNEKTKLFIDLKNDKELVHERVINQKLFCIDSIIKGVIKYRNLKIKDKLKFEM